MNKTTQWRLFATPFIIGLLWAGINAVVPDGSEWITIGVIAGVLSLLWTGQDKKVYKAVATVLIAVAVWLFLSAWKPTSPLIMWLSNRAEENTPRDNFDPRAEKPEALVRFYEAHDGEVLKAPADWRNNPVTGERLVAPGTEEFLRLLTKYEVQKAKGKSPLAAPVNNTCTYCLGAACETTHPATVTGPGQMYIRSEQYGTTAQFQWKLNGEGTWQQTFPESGGTLRWNDANYKSGVLRGTVTDTKHTPGGTWPVVLTCNGEIPIPNS